jgi:hypothetical protein
VAQSEGPEFKPQYCKKRKKTQSQECWCMPVIPALGKERVKDHEFEARLGDGSKTLSQKQSKHKRTGGRAQMIKH